MLTRDMYFVKSGCEDELYGNEADLEISPCKEDRDLVGLSCVRRDSR